MLIAPGCIYTHLFQDICEQSQGILELLCTFPVLILKHQVSLDLEMIEIWKSSLGHSLVGLQLKMTVTVLQLVLEILNINLSKEYKI